jgi:hypothetical protein
MDGLDNLLAEFNFWGKLFFSSLTFSLIKIFLEIYVLVLIVDLILLIKQRGFSSDLRETVLGMNVPPELVTQKSKLQIKWNRIKEKMKSDDQSDYKVAIIEGDNIIDDLIARMGYKGKNFGERLDGINPGQIENIEDLRFAHNVRNQIIHDENFALTKDDAHRVLDCFEEFLRYFQVL